MFKLWYYVYAGGLLGLYYQTWLLVRVVWGKMIQCLQYPSVLSFRDTSVSGICGILSSVSVLPPPLPPPPHPQGPLSHPAAQSWPMQKSNLCFYSGPIDAIGDCPEISETDVYDWHRGINCDPVSDSHICLIYDHMWSDYAVGIRLVYSCMCLGL